MSDKSANNASNTSSSVAISGGSAASNAATSGAAASNYRLPSDVTLQHASKLAIVEDKPVTEYIIITENSIYIVSSEIPTRKIS